MTRSVWLGALALILGIALTPAEGAETTIDWQCSSVNASGATIVGNCPVSTTNPLPVTASVTASISGFAPASVGTPISVTTGGVTGSLPAGTVVVASNVGTTNTAYCALGASSTTAWQPIPPGGWFAYTVGAATQLTCITSTSTTTVNMVGGSGLPTGSGGGGGGSGGAVTIASGGVASGAYASGAFAVGSGTDGWFTTFGTEADTANITTGHTFMAAIRQVDADIVTLNTTAGNPIILPQNVTANDCSGTITNGSTAQDAFTAQTTLHGFTIANVDASAGSGEPLWISFTQTATAANGSYPLAAPTATMFTGLSSFTSPPGMGLNHALSVLGATTGHKFSCTWW